MSLDQFGTEFAMNIEDGETGTKSKTGCLLTLILAVVTVAYTYQKSEILLAKKGMQITVHTNQEAIDETFRFGYEEGFNVAVAFTSYGNEKEYELLEKYGSLRFRGDQWGLNPDGSVYRNNTIFDSHICTREELGLDEDRTDATFMPHQDRQEPFVDMYQKKFICLNKEDLVLWGDFSSDESRQFNIDFVKCNTTERDDCADDAAVEEFVRDKYLLMLSN